MSETRNSNLWGKVTLLLAVAAPAALLSFEVAVANGPALQWQKTFGGSDRFEK
jgi:hypothetical protein